MYVKTEEFYLNFYDKLIFEKKKLKNYTLQA